MAIEGPFLLSWSLVETIEPLPSTAFNNLGPSDGGRLGCGELKAFVTGQCGAPTLCQLTDASFISWGRKLDAISEAQVIIPTGGSNDSECCECLGEIEPWCHELQIFRNGVFVWAGPIITVTYGYEQVIIDARDVLAWTEFRVLECDLDFSQAVYPDGLDVSFMAKKIMETAFEEHDPCVLQHMQVFPTRFPSESLENLPCLELTAHEQLSILSDAAMDYTVLGRSIILGGDDLPRRAIGVLTDEMILGEIEISKNGLLTGNRFYIRYNDDTDVAQCAAQGVDITTRCPCKCLAIVPPKSTPAETFCYGLLEHIRNIELDAEYATALQVAQGFLDAGKIVPRLINFPDGTRISPEVPWEINDMVPGQRIDVALTGLCISVYQPFRILEVNSQQEGLEDEEVTLTLGSLNLIEEG